MRATATLNMVNQETAALFKTSLKNGNNFMERVYVKIGLLISKSILNNAHALITLFKLQDEMIELCGYFDDEKDKFEGLIEKRKVLKAKNINFMARFKQEVDCSNALSLHLMELIEGYDQLLCSLNLLHLSGLIDGRGSFYQLKERYQKRLNTFLSNIVTSPSFKNETLTVEEAIESVKEGGEPSLDLSILKQALHAPYAPGLSTYQLSQLGYKINQALSQKEKTQETLKAE